MGQLPKSTYSPEPFCYARSFACSSMAFEQSPHRHRKFAPYICISSSVASCMMDVRKLAPVAVGAPVLADTLEPVCMVARQCDYVTEHE
ncbi:hypothetical protein PISMIDRAFT_177997 [Pisolithus microcarpus 441]|uniref:Uncharacterized protein n=1 Tax=Pisolithus microcarpus 441 TaxID=765257 RepID=A0A0C9Z8P2_9AGAM|nr:hypothetical protein PISMIDRAFT_177997 [Pisolithus microcarpus 441]